MTTGERLRKARIDAGFTQGQLARKLGISYQSIGQWERNERHPKLETVRKIADALNASMNDLFEIPKNFPGLIDPEYMEEEQNIVNINELYRKEKILEYFYMLNWQGQEKAMERIQELTEVPKYQYHPKK